VFGPPKTRAGRRVVPLPQVVRAELAGLTEANPDPDEFVFSSPHGDVLRVNNFRRRVWDPAVVDARLGNVRIHDLRHTAISLWIAAGLNPKEVSVRAGHSNVAFTLQRYGHLYPESEDRMADALDTLIADSRTAAKGSSNRS
jgi:integrase